MGLFNKKKIPSNDNNFKDPQEISGGNLYENYIKMQAQKEIDANNLMNLASERIDSVINTKIANQSLEPYWLLELQTNYFINTINYEIDDVDVFKNIKLLLRCAFKNGKAALYKMNDKLIYAGISSIEYDLYNNIKSAKIVPLNETTINFKTEDEFNKLSTLIVKDIENLVVLKWGSAGLSSWITIYKMCIIQSELLSMMNVDKYSYIKKFNHIVNNPNASAQEINDYFNPKLPYIKRIKGMDLNNRLEINETYNVIQPNILIEYYKQTMGVYYSLYGRRTNNDYKKERSLTQEIDLTSDNYTILEKDWLDEFKCFTKEIKNKFNIDIKVLENDNLNSDIAKMEKSIYANGENVGD